MQRAAKSFEEIVIQLHPGLEPDCRKAREPGSDILVRLRFLSSRSNWSTSRTKTTVTNSNESLIQLVAQKHNRNDGQQSLSMR